MAILSIVGTAARWTKNIVLIVLLIVVLAIIGVAAWFYNVVVPFEGGVGEGIGAAVLLIILIILLSWLAGLLKVALGAKLTESIVRR
jgi:hypothetical protein